MPYSDDASFFFVVPRYVSKAGQVRVCAFEALGDGCVWQAVRWWLGRGCAYAGLWVLGWGFAGLGRLLVWVGVFE